MSKSFPRTLALATLVALPVIALAMGSTPPFDEEAVNARIQPVAKIRLGAAQAAVPAGDRSGEVIYKGVCGACHDSGVAGAPQMGDASAWAPRIATGLDALMKTVTAGKGAMPPKGGADATDEELRRAIIYMTNNSGANFQ
jgi:cytochrome c5